MIVEIYHLSLSGVRDSDDYYWTRYDYEYDELGNMIEGSRRTRYRDKTQYWTRECEYAYIGV